MGFTQGNHPGRSGTLRVRNDAQAILFEHELKGQISDGQWENALPNDHWEAWCDATVDVDPTNVGRDFFVRRKSYGFSRESFLEDISDRMLKYVRVGIAFGRERVPQLEHLAEYGSLPTYKGEYYDKLRAKFAGFTQADLDKIVAVANDASIYSYEQMRRDLLDLSRIIKIGPN